MIGYLSLWPLACSPFACSTGSGDSSPGGGLGVFRQMHFSPRSAIFNLFKRRLQSNRHRSSGMQGLTVEDTSRDGGFSPSGSTRRCEVGSQGRGSLQLLVVAPGFCPDVIVTYIFSFASPDA